MASGSRRIAVALSGGFNSINGGVDRISYMMFIIQ